MVYSPTTRPLEPIEHAHTALDDDDDNGVAKIDSTSNDRGRELPKGEQRRREVHRSETAKAAPRPNPKQRIASRETQKPQ